MSGKRRKATRQKDQTAKYMAGDDADDEREGKKERFGVRSAGAEERKIQKTALLREAEAERSGEDVEALPVGQVVQVYSLYSDVEGASDKVVRLCVMRKTLVRLTNASTVVGDYVRFRETGMTDERGRPEAVIEKVLERKTLLTRADSFKAIEQHPIVANAQQMLIVASVREPEVRWGLVDRMLVAAKAGKLEPIVCLNKMDLARGKGEEKDVGMALAAMEHYRGMGIRTVETSVEEKVGIEAVRELLAGKVTVLAGHSGVGKSSLITAVQPALDLRVAAISGWSGKGRHTTTSARRYLLDVGGAVVDTPGVKLFGLWGVTRENLPEYFPDVEAGSAPEWRVESYGRILESLPGEE